ncbi:MAG: cytochrome c-type biogenesis protein CcmH [SAR324 cluster bacterium]|nr:cytochrome c-type biogenesis protein CcmH [SAR324 cluster bacterium]
MLAHQVLALTPDELELEVQRISNELRCPTCQGLSVQESSTGFSLKIREKVAELIQEGQSDEQIEAYFVKRYGEWILRAPPKEGFNLILWFLPGVSIVAGLFLVWLRSRYWVQKTKIDPTAAPLTPEEQKLLDKDLKEFNKSEDLSLL